MITSVLVANRGEIARRVFRSCRELGIRTVAVYSDADANMPFVREADTAVQLPGNAPADTYLRGDLIIEAAKRAGADAIHPGYGFLSENADFARAVEAAGLTWIGPSPEAIDSMGSKIRAKEIMAAAGVPVLSVDLDGITPRELPLLVKASAGGGGRGMRVVTSLDDLDRELATARNEAQSAFGDGTVFVEPYLPKARHVEVQILADSHGAVWAVGDRDCSIQRRHQKVVEEAPAPNLSEKARTTLHIAAREAAKAVKYRGAGTVEFLVDGDRVFFLEMNTRLQVEHPVTEEVHGIDLVAWQIAIAEGKPLTGDVSEPQGHAIEVRIYAEDPANDYTPQTGVIRRFDVPNEPGVRVDSAIEAGSEIGVHYDAMIAKIIVHAPDRATAIRKLDDVLRRTVVTGLVTNIGALRQILAASEVRNAELWTSMLEENEALWFSATDTEAIDRAAIAAALAEAQTAATSSPVLNQISAAYRNVPSQPRVREYEGGFQVAYRNTRGRLTTDQVSVISATGNEVVLESDGLTERYEVSVGEGFVDVSGPAGTHSFVPVRVFVDPADVVAEGSLLAPMPAAVTDVAVSEGQKVSKGETIVVLEAMKMQHTLTAPYDGVVSELRASVGQQLQSGEVIAIIEEGIEA